jgi:hypothetical protein
MPWRIETNNEECRSGYAVVKESDGSLSGCHTTRREAVAQIAALNIAEAQDRALPTNYRPALSRDVPEGRACGNCAYYNEDKVQQAGENLLAYCTRWDDYVDGGYYCNAWQPHEEEEQEEDEDVYRAEGYPPTDAMVAEARRGLEWRRAYGRGGTEVGVARASSIINRENLSRETIGRMASFFARHEVDKQGQGFDRGEPGYPSAGRIAWALWGGDPGKSFAEAILAELESTTSE